jgi:hypothetical protein
MLLLPAMAQKVSEYQVKAAYLFNFSKFLEWPRAAFSDQHEPFIIGILGKDPFGSYLDETITGETIMGHPMTVQRYRNIEEIKQCHILFINLPGKTAEAIAALKGKNILTVGDDPDFSANGGMIRFYPENETIRLIINPGAAKDANLTISSKLLRIAKIYE